MIRFLNGKVTLYAGDCIDVLAGLPANSVDSVCCDPPYHLTSMTKARPDLIGKDNQFARRQAATGFMSKTWDGGDIAFQPATWAAVLRVLKPGGHMVAFSGTRTYHRMACAIEDAGFEIRDQLAWMYGSGFPKSHDVSKGIDKAAGAAREVVGPKVRPDGKTALSARPNGFDGGHEGWDRPWKNDPAKVTAQGMETAPATDAAREWQGWGTALKPAWEPICLARKPLIGTVAANVLEWGTGAINVDGCRVGYEDTPNPATNPLYRVQNGYRTEVGSDANGSSFSVKPEGGNVTAHNAGRWPANIVHDGSDEVLAGFPDTVSGAHSGNYTRHTSKTDNTYGERAAFPETRDGDSGSAARFFYTAKADSEDRLGSKHPTVKPLDLKQYLCRLITPPGGTVLDLFAGTGTTGEAAWREGFKAILIEREAEYQADIARRMELAVLPTKRAAVAKTKNKLMGAEGTPLFGGAA